MRNLDLNNYGVQELGAVEMRETDGGCVLCIIAIVAGIAVGIKLYSDSKS